MADLSHIIKIIFILCVLLISCTLNHGVYDGKSGIYHRVKKGETISLIAQMYNVRQESIAKANNIDSKDELKFDSVIFIPGAKVTTSSINYSTVGNAKSEISKKPSVSNQNISNEKKLIILPKDVERSDKIPLDKERYVSKMDAQRSIESINEDYAQTGDKSKMSSKSSSLKERTKSKTDVHTVEHGRKNFYHEKGFLFPVEGKVVSRFGMQPNGLYNNGIEIEAKGGSFVISAADGTVIFSDRHPLKDYGETIIIKHEGEYITVYTNLEKRLAKKGDLLKKGHKIGILANPELKGETIIHFELRHNNKAIDPLIFFPGL